MKLFKKLLDSNLIFGIVVVIFIISAGIAADIRGGRDLKVDLFGVAQVLQKKSPYENPGDPNRPLFRYAPPFALIMRPFLIEKVPSSLLLSVLKFRDVEVGIFYIIKIILLFFTVLCLFKLIPCRDRESCWRNLKLAFLFSMPFLGYELANNQNKLIALFFIILSLFLFEHKQAWLSGIFLNLSLAIYIPLIPFVIYFIKRKMAFLITFIITFAVVFILVPSFVWGFHYNNFLLKSWFDRCLKPFFFTNSYSTYIDLRLSSQSLPSAIGRIFVSKTAGNFYYKVSPLFIHLIIRVLSLLTVATSCIAVWFSSGKTKGLEIPILLILSLITPQYCIYYTWAYLLVIYFCIFNYLDGLTNKRHSGSMLFASVLIIFIVTCLIELSAIKYFSILFWMTMALLFEMIYEVFKSTGFREKLLKKRYKSIGIIS